MIGLLLSADSHLAQLLLPSSCSSDLGQIALSALSGKTLPKLQRRFIGDKLLRFLGGLIPPLSS